MPYKTYLAFTYLPYFLLSMWYNTVEATKLTEGILT